MEKIKGFLYTAGFYLFKFINDYEFEVLGENVPEQALIASNHFGSLDPLLIRQGLERKLIAISKGPGKLFHPPHFIPGIGRIDLSRGLKKAIKSVQEYKERGHSILILWEGNIETKVVEEEIQEMKRGVFYLSEKLDLPILPISLRGVENIWSKKNHQKFPSLRGKVTINVGREIKQSEIRRYSCEMLREEISRLYKQS